MFSSRSLLLSGLLGNILVATSAAQPIIDGQIEGTTQIPSVVGRPSEGAILLRHSVLCISPRGEARGVCRYCPEGTFSFNAPADDCCVLLEPAEPYRRGQIISNLRVTMGTLRWNAKLTPDYNCGFNTMAEWHQNPWAWGTVMEQTFVARGTSVTSVSLKLAGLKEELGDVELSISIRTKLNGKSIGPEQQIKAKPIEDLWVTWKPGEVPTVPGKTYVLRVADRQGKKPIGLFVRREHGFGYPYGELMIDGKPNASDGHFYIGSNADGAVLAYDKTGNEVVSPPAGLHSQTFVAHGTSLAAISVPLVADTPFTELSFAIHQGGAHGKPLGPTKKTIPTRQKDNRFFAGIACPRNEIPLTPGKEYTISMSCSPDKRFSPLADDASTENKALAMRVYEYTDPPIQYCLPPVPTPPGWEFDETIGLINADFELGNQDGWESAWGGTAFTEIVGERFGNDSYSGAASRPHEGKYCAVIAADHTKVKTLIRRWFTWPHGEGGLVHARAWVASPDDATTSTNPLTVRLCVSDHGSPDAGHVTWTEGIVSPGTWTMLQCRPVVPKAKKLSLFLLIEGGNEFESTSVKIDDLQVVIDETP